MPETNQNFPVLIKYALNMGGTHSQESVIATESAVTFFPTHLLCFAHEDELGPMKIYGICSKLYLPYKVLPAMELEMITIVASAECSVYLQVYQRRSRYKYTPKQPDSSCLMRFRRSTFVVGDHDSQLIHLNYFHRANPFSGSPPISQE